MGSSAKWKRFCLSIALLWVAVTANAAEFDLHWKGGGTDLLASPGQVCTLVVVQPNASAADGFLLHIRSLGVVALECPGASPALWMSSSADSDATTLFANRSRCAVNSLLRQDSVEIHLTLPEDVSTMTVTAVPYASGRVLLGPQQGCRTVTTQWGEGDARWADPLSAQFECIGDSVRVLLRGFAMDRLQAVGFVTRANRLVRTCLPQLRDEDTTASFMTSKVPGMTKALALWSSDGTIEYLAVDVPKEAQRAAPSTLLAYMRSTGDASPPFFLSDAISEFRVIAGAASGDQRLPRCASSFAAVSLKEDANEDSVVALLLSDVRFAAVDRNWYELELLAGASATSLLSNDPLLPQQWGLAYSGVPGCAGGVIPSPIGSMRLDEVSGEALSPLPLHVGVLDSGLSRSPDIALQDPEFPDFSAIRSSRQDPTAGDPQDFTNDGHGTAVSSIICATTNNGVGLASPMQPTYADFSPTASPLTVVSGKITSTGGDLTQGLTPVIAGLARFEADPSVRIVNISAGDRVGGSSHVLPSLALACKRCFMAGKLLISSSGNDADSTRFVPAAYSDFGMVLSVGAHLWNGARWTDQVADPILGQPSSGSNYGSWVKVLAPGGRGIVAARQNGTYYRLDQGCVRGDLTTYGFSGTSAAAANASGAAAWLMRYKPSLTSEDVGQVLMRTASDGGAPGFDALYGHGRIDLKAARDYVSSPRWLQPVVAQGTATPGGLEIAPDSSANWALRLVDVADFGTRQGSTPPDTTVVSTKYHLKQLVYFGGVVFADIPDVWVRRATTCGLSESHLYDADFDLPDARLTSVRESYALAETFVYRVGVGANSVWIPCSPEEARIEFAAVGVAVAAVKPTERPERLALSVGSRTADGGLELRLTGVVTGPLRVEVYDVLGRRVSSLHDGQVQAGELTLRFNPPAVGGKRRPAIYFGRAEQVGGMSTAKLLVMR